MGLQLPEDTQVITFPFFEVKAAAEIEAANNIWKLCECYLTILHDFVELQGESCLDKKA